MSEQTNKMDGRALALELRCAADVVAAGAGETMRAEIAETMREAATRIERAMTSTPEKDGPSESVVFVEREAPEDRYIRDELAYLAADDAFSREPINDKDAAEQTVLKGVFQAGYVAGWKERAARPLSTPATGEAEKCDECESPAGHAAGCAAAAPITCETQGHLWGPLDKCVMCEEPRPSESVGDSGSLKQIPYTDDALRLLDDYAQITSLAVLYESTGNPEQARLLRGMGALIQHRVAALNARPAPGEAEEAAKHHAFLLDEEADSTERSMGMAFERGPRLAAALRAGAAALRSAHSLRAGVTEPDGYVVVLADKSAPKGYWFVGAYHNRATAEEWATKNGKAASVRPFALTAALGKGE